MPATSTITFTISPLPTGTAVDANQYAQLLASSLQATLTGNFLTGQIDGTPPTQNIGVWLNQGAWYIWDPGSNSYVPQTVTTNPSGTILMYAGTVAPTGYLFCDGTLYLRSSFPALYATIGDVYGPNDGVSTFRVPDFRGRVPVGAGTGTSVIGANLNDLTPRSNGDNFGHETHTLVVGETPSHFHGMAHSHTMGNHTHVGQDHEHDLRNHTHGLPDHTHNDDHAHIIGAGQFNHQHGLGGHFHSYTFIGTPTGGGIASGGNVYGNVVGGASTGPPSGPSDFQTLPGGGTNGKNASGYGLTTGNVNGSLTSVGPSINNTGFSLQGLTTSAPNNNNTDPTTKTSTDPIGGSGAHENMQPSMVCHFIVKT